ncbi:MAG: WD40/YVTN/BNR-like repeat-containing protein [Clostridia bacterium]
MRSVARAAGILGVSVLLAGCATHSALQPATVAASHPAKTRPSPSARSTIVPRASIPASPTLPAFTTLAMVTASAGWGATQGQVFWTDTGWRAWAAVTPANLPADSALVLDPINAATAWVGVSTDLANGPAPLFLTTDHGQSWREITVPGSVGGLSWPHFFSTERGYVAVGLVGSMGSETLVIQATDDGGTHWHTLPGSISEALVTSGHIPPPSAHRLPWFGDKSGVVWATPSDGWMSGGHAGSVTEVGMLYRTTDGGVTWFPVALPGRGVDAPQWVLPPIFRSAVDGVVPVQIGPRTYVVDQTVDGGATWRAGVPLPWDPAGDSLWTFTGGSMGLAVSKVLNAAGTAVTTSALYRTTDAGRTWTILPTKLPLDAVTAIDLVTRSIAYASCNSGQTSALWESTDGGVMWTPVSPRRPGAADIRHRVANGERAVGFGV